MTYENPHYEEGINLLALIVSGLRKWKQLIIIVVMMALLFGLYKGVFKAGTVGSDTEIEELQIAMDENVALLESNESTIEINETQIENYQERILSNKKLLAELQNGQSMLQNTKEMLEVTFSSTLEVMEDEALSLDQKSAIIAQLAILADDIASTNNQILSSIQQIRNVETEIKNLEMSIENLIDQNNLLDEGNGETLERITEQENEMARLNKKVGLTPALIYAVLGGFLGFVVFYGIIFLQIVFDKKLRAADELRKHYTFPVLGEFLSAKAKEHNKFNQKLDRLTGDVQTLPEKQQVYELIAAGIQAGTSVPVKLIITGTVEESKIQEVGSAVRQQLPDGYSVEIAGNPVYNADLLVNLKQYEVLLVEAKGVSLKPEISKLVDVLQRNEIKVVGSVVM